MRRLTSDIQRTACQQPATQWRLRADTSDADTGSCRRRLAVDTESRQRHVECPQRTARRLLPVQLQQICFTRSNSSMRRRALQIFIGSDICPGRHRSLKFTPLSFSYMYGKNS